MDEREYKLSIQKEVLAEYVAGMSARYFHAAWQRGVVDDKTHPFRIKEMEIFDLKTAVRDAKTMEELEAINNKLLKYHSELSSICAPVAQSTE
jgi:hypothetical protein